MTARIDRTARIAHLAWTGVVAGALMGALGAGLAGCAEKSDTPAEPNAETPAAEGVSHTSEVGPVRATVTLSPKQPVLGDPLTLSLEVVAEPGVEVEMPAFGEALGRFEIVQFVPREQRDAGGKLVASQTYTLQAPMSGRQRIPPLQVEFVDRRNAGASAAAGTASPAAGTASPAADPAAGTTGAAAGTAGPAAGGTGAAAGTASPAAADEVQELLTEEIPIQIGSVLPEGEVTAELEPQREALPLRSRVQLYVWLGLAALVLLGVGGFLGVRAWQRAARRQVRISAYDRAMARLRELEQRGLPRPGQDESAPAPKPAPKIDVWYVELSAIVRRYLEDRYGLRAPELTTEEFLREAQRSGQLSSRHRDLLSDFLVRCDRVKFARYEPDEEESRQALASARTFLEETRLVAASDARAGQGGQATGGGQAAVPAASTAPASAPAPAPASAPAAAPAPAPASAPAPAPAPATVPATGEADPVQADQAGAARDAGQAG